MNVAASVGDPPLSKSKTVIVELGPVAINTAAIGSEYSDVLRREVQNLLKLPFALSDLFFCLLCCGDVCRGTHELHHISRCVQNRLADGVDVFYRAVWKKNSEFHFVVGLFSDGSINCPLPLGSILRMSALQTFFKSRRAIFWIEAINAVPFLGQMQGVSSRYPPGPTPCVREPLRLRQVRLTSLQLLFLQFQGLGSESPIDPGRQQSQPEDDKRDGGNSGGAKCGDAYGVRQVRRQARGHETGRGHAGVMHDGDRSTHHHGSG